MTTLVVRRCVVSIPKKSDMSQNTQSVSQSVAAAEVLKSVLKLESLRPPIGCDPVSNWLIYDQSGVGDFPISHKSKSLSRTRGMKNKRQLGVDLCRMRALLLEGVDLGFFSFFPTAERQNNGCFVH